MIDPADEMTFAEEQAIAALRDRGFVVVVWTPGEIGNADPDGLEDVTIERGWNFIADGNSIENDEEAE